MMTKLERLMARQVRVYHLRQIAVTDKRWDKMVQANRLLSEIRFELNVLQTLPFNLYNPETDLNQNIKITI